MSSIIVKVQLPIASSHGAPVMVYNEDRTKMAMMELSQEDFLGLQKRMKECEGAEDYDYMKGFFYATIQNNGNGHERDFIIGEPAPWQDW